MIADLKPYPQYREPEADWMGKIPIHWEVRRLKTVLHETDCRSRDGKGVLLSLTRNRGLIARSDFTDKAQSAKTLVGYKIYEPNQIVMNRMQAWSGMFGLAQIAGLISPDYASFEVLGNNNPKYLLSRIKSPDMVEQFALESKGIGSGFNRLYSDRFGIIPVNLPPPDEQEAIVRFLDHANRKIDRYVRTKKKLITLLNEQKQAIIHRAVTRGLPSKSSGQATLDAPLKDSGIPWLGKIPEHWEVWRISRFAKVGNGSTPSRSNMSYWSGGTFPWLNSSHVNRGLIDSADQYVTAAALRQCHLPKVSEGSVLVAITGQGKTRGTSAVLAFEATINQHIAYITPRLPIISADFLHFSLVAAYSTLRAISDDSGSTKGALTCEDLKRFKLAVPPLDEQATLVKDIVDATKATNTAINRAEHEVELLNEYRTRLTADVVTGKLDVREAAANLPAFAEASAGEPTPEGSLEHTLPELDEEELLEGVE